MTLAIDPDLLLGEFRHRMGNDLALVVNILERQRSSLTQLTAGEALDNAVDALMALSLLYRLMDAPPPGQGAREESGSVDLGEYLTALASHVRWSYLQGLGCELTLDTDSGYLPATVARNAGLIIVELLANAAKHAFPKDSGQIVLRCAFTRSRCHCTVEDNGVGTYPNGVHGGQGLSFVRRLTDSIHGTLNVASGPQGTIVSLGIPIAAALPVASP